MPRSVRTIALALMSVVVVGLQLPPAAAQTKPAPGAGVTVTVKYTGKGAVDAQHKIWVWLFDTPEINAGSIPIAEQSIEKNGGTASFSGLTSKQVYAAIAYDEAGGFAGQAPPPSGSPIALYGAKGPEDKPLPIAPGAKGKVTVTFSDMQRMP